MSFAGWRRGARSGNHKHEVFELVLQVTVCSKGSCELQRRGGSEGSEGWLFRSEVGIEMGILLTGGFSGSRRVGSAGGGQGLQAARWGWWDHTNTHPNNISPSTIFYTPHHSSTIPTSVAVIYKPQSTSARRDPEEPPQKPKHSTGSPFPTSDLKGQLKPQTPRKHLAVAARTNTGKKLRGAFPIPAWMPAAERRTCRRPRAGTCGVG